MHHNRRASCRVPHQKNAIDVAIEERRVPAHPFKRHQLVFEAEISRRMGIER